MTGTPVTVELSGPFFQRDPGETLRGNIERMMQGLAEEGEKAGRDGFAATQAGRLPISQLGDRVSGHVVGRVVSLRGRRWRATAVVSINNFGYTPIQGISLMAAASSVERRTHVMRNLARSIRSSRAVLNANLTKGIE